MKRPECFDFALDFVGEPEETQVRQYVEGLEARLAEAQAIIGELCDHEGAEGFSADLNERLARFSTANSASTGESESHG